MCSPQSSRSAPRYGGYSWLSQEQAQIVYTTVPAETGGLTVTVSATGTLQPLTQVDISSELSGVVRTVAVDENDLVHKGDVLAELDTTRLAAQVEGAEASAKAAAARVDDARTTLKESEQALARADSSCRRAAWSPTRRWRRRPPPATAPTAR